MTNGRDIDDDEQGDDFEQELRGLFAQHMRPASMATVKLREGSVVSDRFELLERLGGGSMGMIWRADDLDTGQTVALKIMRPSIAADPTLRHRFKREARHAAALQHPNIVSVIDSGQDGGVLYLAMEYVQGEPLSDVIFRGALGWPRAGEIGVQVLAALRCAHRHSRCIIHRDIKPSNVFLVGEPGQEQARVLDFGIARGMMEESLGTQGPIGSPLYMAPEIWLDQELGPEADVYSFGCTMYEMLVGRPPFEGGNIMILGRQHLQEAPSVPQTSAPQPVARWVERCMAKDRSKRPADAGVALEELSALLKRETP